MNTPNLTQPPPATSFRQFNSFKTYWSQCYQTFNDDVIIAHVTGRKIRRFLTNDERMRQTDRLQADEILVPVRIIDRNIAQKLPPKIAYLKSANRLAIFEPQTNYNTPGATKVISEIESEFWRVMTYDGWEVPYIQAFDGAEMLGWSWLEVLYTPDPARAGNVSVNMVGRQDLIFDLGVNDIQDSKMIAKRVPITLVTLTELAKLFGFKKEDILLLRGKIQAQSTNDIQDDYCDALVHINRVFWKENGVVWTSWFAEGIDHWLNEPHEFFNGVSVKEQIPETNPLTFEVTMREEWKPRQERAYPFYPVLRRLTEDKRIAMQLGSVDIDYATQEAATAMFTSYVSQARRSALLLASPHADTYDKSGAPKQLPLKLEDGQIWDRPMQFFSPEPPNAQMPTAINQLETLNAEQNQNVAWAVNNRQDSRKTATEVAAAEQQNTKFSASDTFMLSLCLRPVWAAAWSIIQSQALQGEITFCPIEGVGNNIELIARDYRLKAAGDTDYVERQQTLQNMMQDWGVVQNTPIAGMFLSDYLKLRYPDRGEIYSKSIETGNQREQQLAQLLQVAVVEDDGTLKPEFRPYQQQLEQLLNGSNSTQNVAQPAANTGNPQPAQAGT